jgi:muramidase (phage lysozyme)
MRIRKFDELARMDAGELNDLICRLNDILESLFNYGEDDTEDYFKILNYQNKVEDILTLKQTDGE